MKKRLVFILLLFLSLTLTTTAQTVVQPKIMVIPYAREGEDYRTIIEHDVNKRTVLTKIKEAFDNRGVTTVDFLARLKAAETENVFNMSNKQNVKSQIIDMSGADIYVEAEIICAQNYNDGKLQSRVRVNITAYDIATGASLANKVGESGTFYTNDIGKLGMRAIESCADDFLRVMQQKFSEIPETGKSMMLVIGFDENSRYTMESEVGTEGLLLQDEIELYVDSHSYNNNYHLQGVSSSKMIFDDVKLPILDETTGNNYTVSKYGIEMMKFFRALGITISRNTKGNTLYITIK